MYLQINQIFFVGHVEIELDIDITGTHTHNSKAKEKNNVVRNNIECKQQSNRMRHRNDAIQNPTKDYAFRVE